jgi:hypothetical protein
LPHLDGRRDDGQDKDCGKEVVLDFVSRDGAFPPSDRGVRIEGKYSSITWTDLISSIFSKHDDNKPWTTRWKNSVTL